MRRSIEGSDIGLSNPPLAQDNHMTNSSGLTPSTPSLQKSHTERETRDNAPKSSTPMINKSASDNEEHWFVVWATRHRIPAAIEFYQKVGASTFAPVEKVTRRENGKLRHKDEYILNNRLFVFTSQAVINKLKVDCPTSPFTRQMKDRTRPRIANHYPPMIIPTHEMENFILGYNSDDPNFQLVEDPSRLRMKGEGDYLIVKGNLKGMKGMRVRYKKQDRIATKLGNWIFASGYIPESFIKPYINETGDELFEPIDSPTTNTNPQSK